jgi:hypothetical protein
MKALVYLLRTRLKNQLLSLKKKPAMLILYLIITAFVVFSIVMMIVSDADKSQIGFADERILYAIFAGLGLLYVYLFANSGVSTGSSLFTMPDVGLLFVAPVSSKKILMYGLISTFGKSLLGSIFILYQIGNLKQNFNYGALEILTLFVVFALMVLFCQLLSIGIYIFTNGNPSRKKLVLGMVYALFVFIALTTLYLQRQEQIGIFDALLKVIDAKWFGYIPVAGWSLMLFTGVIHGSLANALIGLALFLVVGGLIIFLLTMGKADYYEDVLVSTETTYQKLKDAKEGRTIQRSNKKVKVKDNEVGINKGSGAYTFLYKHMLEMRRRSRFIFVDTLSIFLIAGGAAAGYFFKKYAAPVETVYGVLGVAVYMQFIFSMMGKLKGELLKPYIFLIPEKSVKKVFAASLTSFIKQAVDGIVLFAAFSIALGSFSAHSLFAAVAYTSSGAVFVALTVLYQRVLGGQPNRIVQGILSVFLLAIIIGPAIALTVITAYILPNGLDFLCTVPFSIFCILATLVIFIACGNLIEKSEFTGKI